MSIIIIILIVFFILLLIGVPIAFALGIGAIISIFVGNFPLTLVPNLMFSSINSFPLLAVPMFILTGTIMEYSGLSQKIFDFANSLIGWATGGLGAVNILASLIFGGISGSATADVASLGPIEVSAMEKYGYPKNYAGAITIASSSLSQLIPPSIIMVLYALTAGVSAIKMLLAGLIPGVLIALSLGIVNYIYCKHKGWGKITKFSFKKVIHEGKKAIWAILSPIILLAGIMSGYFTPTEAGFVAAVYTLIVGLFIYKEIEIKDIGIIFIKASRRTGVALMILATASIVAHLLSREGVPQAMVNWIQILPINSKLILLLLCGCILLVGCFIEAIAAVIIFVPILSPAMHNLGIDPINLGVLIVCSLSVGLLTPPVGMGLFTLVSVVKIRMEEVIPKTIPFIFAIIIVIIILVMFPSISTFLPNLLM